MAPAGQGDAWDDTRQDRGRKVRLGQPLGPVLQRRAAWFFSSGGTGAWTQFGISNYLVKDLRFGDFTGDGHTDIFNAADGKWKIVSGLGLPWVYLGSAQLAGDTSSLVVADFDGDGKADVAANTITAGQSTWSMSSAGTGAAHTFATSDQFLVSLPIGKFDDKLGADVLPWHNDLWLQIVSPFVDQTWSRQFMR